MVPTEKLLFTPGPLTTSPTVKQAMLKDMGSRDDTFIRLIAEIRSSILKVAGVGREDGFETIPIQGSGTYGIEAVFATVIGPSDRLLVLVNGAYGRRMVEMAKCYGLHYEVYEVQENAVHDRATLESLLNRTQFTHLAAVHCETTTGILNPIELWGAVTKEHGCQFIVDAMSSFGGIPLDLSSVPVDYLISSSNKCLQGVPGVAFIVARRESLMAGQHEPRSVSLNLRQQLLAFESNGQFRFTPPTHVVLALHQALIELEVEGGVGRRAARYKENHQVLCAGMQALGFREYLPTALQSHIITAFLYPEKNFVFEEFYRRLSERGMLIYPGKLSKVDCFRIGNIGHLFPQDITELLHAIKAVMSEMNSA
jgi:2-aminoethylphosphonate-pyruvate transaminase